MPLIALIALISWLEFEPVGCRVDVSTIPRETLLADLAYRSDNTLTSDLSKFILSLILVNFLSISAGSI